MKGALTRTAQLERLATRPIAIDSLAVLGALPVAVVLLDPTDRFRYANQAAEQFRLFTGHEAPYEAMAAAGRAALGQA